MLHDRRSALSRYVSGLLSAGQTVYAAEEAEHDLGIGHGTFLDAAERPLGYLLDHLGYDGLTEPMLQALRARGPLPWAELDRKGAQDPDFAPEPRQRDLRWRVIVRRVPRVDA